jgi:hypothetical protein
MAVRNPWKSTNSSDFFNTHPLLATIENHTGISMIVSGLRVTQEQQLASHKPTYRPGIAGAIDELAAGFPAPILGASDHTIPTLSSSSCEPKYREIPLPHMEW